MGAYTAVAASNFNGFETPKTVHFMDEVTWFVFKGSKHDSSHFQERHLQCRLRAFRRDV